MTGKIALVKVGNGCSISQHIQVAQNAGAVACIVLSGPLSLCQYIDKDSNKFDNDIASICIPIEGPRTRQFEMSVFESVMDKNKSVTVRFSVNGSPIFRLNQSALVFMQVFFLTLFSLLILFTSYRTFVFIKNDQRFSFPVFIFILVIIGKYF